MPDQLIRPNEGNGATFFAGSGMAKLNIHRDIILALLDKVEVSSWEGLSDSEIEIAAAWLHEVVHFIQSISTSFLYSYAQNIFLGSLNLLNHFDAFVSKPEPFTLQLVECRRRFLDRQDGISVQDICEGVAVLESFRMTRNDGGVDDFLAFRNNLFPGDHSSVYRRTFDVLSYATDPDTAFSWLSPLSYWALQDEFPGYCFDRLIGRLIKKGCPRGLRLENIPGVLGVIAESSFLFRAGQFQNAVKHPILYKYVEAINDLLGPERFCQIGEIPALLFWSSLAGDDKSMFFPPIVSYAYYHGEKIRGSMYGLAKDDKDMYWLINDCEALLGAVERIVFKRKESGIYRTCPYPECPHFEAALCHRKFPPPNVASGWQKCSFPRDFQKLTKRLPNEAWAEISSNKALQSQSVTTSGEQGDLRQSSNRFAHSLDEYCKERSGASLYTTGNCIMHCHSCDKLYHHKFLYFGDHFPESVISHCEHCGAEDIADVDDFAHFSNHSKSPNDMLDEL